MYKNNKETQGGQNLPSIDAFIAQQLKFNKEILDRLKRLEETKL